MVVLLAFLLSAFPGHNPPPSQPIGQDSTSRFSSAIAHFNSAEYRDALRLFDELSSSGSDSSLDYYRGVCFYQLGNYAGAIANLRRVGRSDSLFGRASFYLAETMLAVYDLRAAIASFRNSLAADSSYLPARLEYIRVLCAVDST